MHSALLATVALAALGWSDITVSPTRNGSANAPWQRSLANLSRPTERTDESLRRYELTREYRSNAKNALLRLEKIARQRPEPELVFALAELSWIEARKQDRWRKSDSLRHDIDVVAYAFDFLFDPDLASGRQPTDPRFLQAIHLYNGALDRVIRAMKAKGPIQPGGNEVVLETREQPIRLLVNMEKSPWTPVDVDELLVASDFQVSGLPSHAYQYGLGVPLIGVRRAASATDPKNPAEPTETEHRYFPPEMAFPLTAFLRPNSRLRDPAADVEEIRSCTLDLVDPVQVRNVHLGEHAVAIEADLTTPLAYMWSRTDYGSLKWTGFLRPGDVLERSGLMLIRPYEPGKIPVVLVHGLMSSPLVWIPMVNELLRDPEIQSRYQFFMYVYPTGVPIPIAASYLRNALQQAQADFNSSGLDAAFDRMVLLGHSMGGLLSHAMAVDSQNHFWHLSSYWDFNRLIGPTEVINRLAHYTFFKPLPFVERVVFLATPHRGSEYANGFFGRLGSNLITQPDEYASLLTQLVKNNPDAFNTRRFSRLPTSIETLTVDAPVLNALLAMPPRPGVSFHSIIGARSPGAPAETTDGVVPYRSSHFEKAVSEVLVASDHSVPKAPGALQEVRRILRLHLTEQPRSSPRGIAAPAVAAPASVPIGLARKPTDQLIPGNLAIVPVQGIVQSPAPSSNPTSTSFPAATTPTRPFASPLDNLPPLMPLTEAP